MLKEDQVPEETKPNAFGLLWKLAGASRQVPNSYLVDESAKYKVEGGVIASSDLADIREGRLRGMVVAVKTIHVSHETQINAIRQVRKVAGCVILVNLLMRHTKSRPSAGDASSG